MIADSFQCFLVQRSDQGTLSTSVETVPFWKLPPGDVLIKVAYSSLNFKDALSATGHPGVTQKFPHVPGIDAAGHVVESSTDQFRAGDKVVVTGFDLGMNTWGGFAEYVRVPAAWVMALAEGMSLRDSMAYGTAGFTTGLCVQALLDHGVRPASGAVLVTGATGGVGMLSVAILGKLGYRVVAMSGKPEHTELLQRLGAAEVVGRDAVDGPEDRPLLKPQWAGAVDTVGGRTLANILRSMRYDGAVAACGLVGGVELPTSVYPFILRGVKLLGIDSVNLPLERRAAVWNRLARDWRPPDLEDMLSTVALTGLAARIERILAGQNVGRTLVVPSKTPATI